MIWYNAVTMQKYISSTPDIMGGAPVIKGTRTPIEVLLYRLKEGNSVEAIHEMYPWIDIQTLSGAIHKGRSLIILMDGLDLMAILEGRIGLLDLLRRKRRHAAQTGEIFISVINFY